MRYFVILLGLAFAGFIIAPLTISQGFALCMINEDWQDAPCWGLRCTGNEPACTDPNWWKERWVPYYDHKGKDWMESKKQELLSAIKSKSLASWLALTVNGTNTNVHDYYYYMGEVPNRYGVKVNQAFAGWYPPLKQMSVGMASDDLFCRENLSLIFKKNGSPACVTYPTGEKLVKRGWATCDDGIGHNRGHPCGPRSSGVVSFDSYKVEPEPVTSLHGLQVDVTGQQQVRRGTTHDIVVDVFRDTNPVSDALVRITIEDYGEDVIRDFKGRTDDSGRFMFSWEIPKSFDDIKTLLAYVDVTDDISAKTVLFKFQVYCLPGETGCKVEGN